MMVSTKGRYALRVMIDLAEHNTGVYTPLKEIAERQEISEKYLESIIAMLVRAGYLTGLRGKGGGYQLVRSPEQYTVRSILEVTEGPLVPVACLADSADHCNRRDTCKTLSMWQRFGTLVNEYFDNITIADLVYNRYDQDQYVI